MPRALGYGQRTTIYHRRDHNLAANLSLFMPGAKLDVAELDVGAKAIHPDCQMKSDLLHPMVIDSNLLEQLFSAANLFVLPFWALMILAPNTKLARTVMGSLLPMAALAGLYLFLFITSFGNVEGLEAFSDPNLSLADLAALFANPHVTATGWVHYLAFDLFVGRWIYWQGQDTGVFTRHSLALTLFAGPMGLLSHLITDALGKRFMQREVKGEGDEVRI